MRPLKASELVDVWERGQARPASQRALLLLSAACPEVSPDDLARLSIGQRDGLLLTLREWTFGKDLVSVLECPGCRDRLELEFHVADLRAPARAPDPDERLALVALDYQVRLRLPNSLDLQEVSSVETNLETARRRLFERCALEVVYRGETQKPADVPEEVVAEASRRLAEADPQSDMRLSITCPGCRREAQVPFDIGRFFWTEIHAWVLRTLREVHALAKAYGWGEADILALSPLRRRLYLDMVGA